MQLLRGLGAYRANIFVVGRRNTGDVCGRLIDLLGALPCYYGVHGLAGIRGRDTRYQIEIGIGGGARRERLTHIVDDRFVQGYNGCARRCCASRSDDDIGAADAKFFGEPVAGIHLEVQECGGERRAGAEGQENYEQSAALGREETANDAPEHFAIGHLFASQNGRWLIARSALQRNGTAQKSYACGEGQDDDENQDGRLWSHAKDFFAQDTGEDDAECVTYSAAHKCE